MFSKPTSEAEAGLLNESSCLALALGVAKIINMRDMLSVQQTHLCFIQKNDTIQLWVMETSIANL